jgi:hypothetical protein
MGHKINSDSTGLVIRHLAFLVAEYDARLDDHEKSLSPALEETDLAE